MVFTVVLLGVSQNPVTQSEHVLVGSILLISQFFQTQQWTFSSTPVFKWGLDDPKDLDKHTHITIRLVCSL